MAFWREIENEIFQNKSLDIYEKMCLMVLMSQGEEVHLTSEQLADYMGCGINTAKRAFDSLRLKGFLSKDYENEPPVRRESNVLGGSDVVEIAKPLVEESDQFQAGFFTKPSNERQSVKSESAEPYSAEADRKRQMAAYLLSDDADPGKPFVSKKVTNQSLTDQVIAMVEEKISSKEANIILAFANNDIEKIKHKYKIAKQSQVSDTIGVLINELQKKDSPVIKGGDPLSNQSSTGPSNSDQTQVNTNRLLKMQAYQNSRLKHD